MYPYQADKDINYSPENVERVLRNLDFYRKRIEDSRKTVIEELLRLQDLHAAMTATSAVRINAEAVSKTYDISDPTALKAIKLINADTDTEIIDLQNMLKSNEAKERELSRIYRCFAKSADFLPLHFYVANLAWNHPGIPEKSDKNWTQGEIAKEIGRAKKTISAMIKNEARIISIMAASDFEQLSIITSAEWLSFIKCTEDKLYEAVKKYEDK